MRAALVQGVRVHTEGETYKGELTVDALKEFINQRAAAIAATERSRGEL